MPYTIDPLEFIREQESRVVKYYSTNKTKLSGFEGRQDFIDCYLHEIYFYEKLKEKFPNISFTIEGKYKNSNMRYDFNVFGDYIEICPLYGQKNQEKYTMKMDKKMNLFNSLLLKSTKEIDEYLERKNASRII